jgi:hypothetical protein
MEIANFPDAPRTAPTKTRPGKAQDHIKTKHWFQILYHYKVKNQQTLALQCIDRTTIKFYLWATITT